MDGSVRVFISSTWKDLQPEREAVEKALHRMQRTSFAGMEYFGSRPDTPKDVSLEEVDESDVYVGIFAHRYGSGITEAEYRRARERDLPCLIYVKDESVPVAPAHIEREPDKRAKLDALREELMEQHTVSFFTSPDQLATQVVTDLHNQLGSAPTEREGPPKQAGSKYNIHIEHGQGIAIGDNAQVTQDVRNSGGVFQSSSGSKPWLVQVKGEHRVYRVDQDGSRHLIPDGPTLESIARWEDIDTLANWEELARFSPARPHRSVVHGVQPWLVQVRGESSIYYIDDDGSRHRIAEQAMLESINPRTDVDVFVSMTELKQFPPGEPVTALPRTSSDQNSSGSYTTPESTALRLQHLADNIQQDLALLKEYEDALRYEDDPRRRAKYRREIEGLRASAERYQQEYDALRAEGSDEQPAAMQDIATQLQQMNARLDDLRDAVAETRAAILSRFDESERAVVTEIVQHLDSQQLRTVEAVIEAVDAGRLPDEQMHQLVSAAEGVLNALEHGALVVPDPTVAKDVAEMAEIVKASGADVRHKLKVSVPIIPLVLAYEGEVELQSGVKLDTLWQRIVASVRGG